MGAVSAECVNHEGGVALPGIGGGLPCCGHEAGVPHQGQHKILGNKIRAEALAVGRSASARRLTRGRRPASHKPAGRSRRNRTRRPVPGGLSRFGEHVRAALTMRSQLRSASARNAGLCPAEPVASERLPSWRDTPLTGGSLPVTGGRSQRSAALGVARGRRTASLAPDRDRHAHGAHRISDLAGIRWIPA